MSHTLHAPHEERHETPPEDQPRGTKRWDFAEWAHVLANVSVILSALIVVPMYMVERNDANELERQQLAAQMFQRKYDSRVMEAYTKVSDAFDSNNTLFRIFPGPQEDAKQAAGEKIIGEAGLDNVKIVIDYYNDLLVCVEQKLCDRELSARLIGQDIRNFYCKARFVGLPQLRQRYDYAEYGEPLARFAGDCDKPAAPVMTE